MIKQPVTIQNKLGLHARASAKLINLASRFGSEIHLTRDDKTVNCKSIMGVMMLAASKGVVLELTLEGDDEQAACDAIVTLFNERFGEAE